MISIIIASVNSTLLNQVSLNIKQTIGLPFEIIAIENSKNPIGLCALYNNGAAKAQYEILCFMHEDILLQTKNWGTIVVDLFKKDADIGLIGVAGTQYKSAAPSGWHSNEDIAPELLNYNFYQSNKLATAESELRYANPNKVKLAPAICIDGLWMCCTRQAFSHYCFDEKLLKGFHGYDLDFSIGIGQRYRVAITFEILMTHFSEGNMDKKWTQEILKVHEKWMSLLPLSINKIESSKMISFEKRNFKTFINKMIVEDFGLTAIQKLLFMSRKSRVFDNTLLMKLEMHLLKTLIKLK